MWLIITLFLTLFVKIVFSKKENEKVNFSSCYRGLWKLDDDQIPENCVFCFLSIPQMDKRSGVWSFSLPTPVFNIILMHFITCMLPKTLGVLDCEDATLPKSCKGRYFLWMMRKLCLQAWVGRWECQLKVSMHIYESWTSILKVKLMPLDYFLVTYRSFASSALKELDIESHTFNQRWGATTRRWS